MPRPAVAEHTIVVYSDIGCPWATVAVIRLLRERSRQGLDGRIQLDHRWFPLEILNSQATPKKVLDAEIPVVAELEPDVGWTTWRGDPSAWPVTTAPAAEAVQAAKEQSPAAAEQLDLALRLALFRDSRCISLRNEILDIAADCDGVDVAALAAAVDDGRARGPMMRDFATHREAVQGSPHLFLPDGGDAHNPGIQMRWEGRPGAGHPVVDKDDPSAYAQLLHRV